MTDSNTPGNGVGVGVPGRTGVKGVIRDRNEAERSARDKKAAEIRELNKKMEKASTFSSVIKKKRLMNWARTTGRPMQTMASLPKTKVMRASTPYYLHKRKNYTQSQIIRLTKTTAREANERK